MIILIKVTQAYEGIFILEARPSTEAEIIPMVQKGHDFQGERMRIFVLPIHCELDKTQALDIAKRYADSPFGRLVDFAAYSKLQAGLSGGLKRNQQYNRRRWKGGGKRKQQDRHHLDLSSESE